MSRAWMKAGGFEPRPTLVSTTWKRGIAAVAAGFGMGFIPRPVGDEGPSLDGTVMRPLDPPLIRTLARAVAWQARGIPPCVPSATPMLALWQLPMPQAPALPGSRLKAARDRAEPAPSFGGQSG